MGKNYYTGPEDFIHIDNYYDKMIEKNFKDNENQIKGDFNAKIRNLQSFYQEMNRKYDFQHMNKKDLHNKLKEMNIQNKKNRARASKMEEPSLGKINEKNQKFKIFKVV